MQTPAPFGYERATSVDHAIQLLEQLGPDARLVAGGHSFIPLLKLRFAAPGHIIDLGRLTGLRGISESDGWLRVGATTTHGHIEHHDLVTLLSRDVTARQQI